MITTKQLKLQVLSLILFYSFLMWILITGLIRSLETLLEQLLTELLKIFQKILQFRLRI